MANVSSDTITVLLCPNGSTVTLVGTAHFSKDSIRDVRQTIQSVKPQVVVLELCPARQVILTHSEEQIREQAKSLNWGKVREIIRRDGVVVGVTQAVFLKLSANIMDKLGVAPGGEFRAGYEEAVKVNSNVMLGDRLVGVTFKRALQSLSLWQRIKFVYMLVQSLVTEPDLTPDDVERMKNRDMVSMLIGELGSELPGLSKVFIEERDQILAHNLMRAANCVEEPYGPARQVVGVVGIGHVTGIEANWMKSRDVRHLLVVPRRSLFSTIAWMTLKYGSLGLVCVGLGATVVWLGRRWLLGYTIRKLISFISSRFSTRAL